jgi:hypothetical protein
MNYGSIAVILCLLLGFPKLSWPRYRAGLLCGEEASGRPSVGRKLRSEVSGRTTSTRFTSLRRYLGDVIVSNDVTVFRSVADHITPFGVADKTTPSEVHTAIKLVFLS